MLLTFAEKEREADPGFGPAEADYVTICSGPLHDCANEVPMRHQHPLL